MSSYFTEEAARQQRKRGRKDRKRANVADVVAAGDSAAAARMYLPGEGPTSLAGSNWSPKNGETSWDTQMDIEHPTFSTSKSPPASQQAVTKEKNVKKGKKSPKKPQAATKDSSRKKKSPETPRPEGKGTSSLGKWCRTDDEDVAKPSRKKPMKTPQCTKCYTLPHTVVCFTGAQNVGTVFQNMELAKKMRMGVSLHYGPHVPKGSEASE